jgi:hypothetical protein
MAPFLMTVVSDSDIWLYASSAGGLSAGRSNPDRALFAYETDDRIHRNSGLVGPLTLIRVSEPGGRDRLWQPLDPRAWPSPHPRSLYKAVRGNWLEFEERNEDLGLAFSYRWSTGHRHGLIRTARLRRIGDSAIARVEILDGILQVQPAEVPASLQQGSSCLVDAYKRNELLGPHGLVAFSLEARISDRAEPMECLRANIAWHRGPPGAQLHLSERAVNAFRAGQTLHPQPRSLGETGAYLLHHSLRVEEDRDVSWQIIADAHVDQCALDHLVEELNDEHDWESRLLAEERSGAEALERRVAMADGLQHTNALGTDAHHFANVLFNIMRGGLPLTPKETPSGDFETFLQTHNRPAAASRSGPDFERLRRQYLPFHFGRRHGDPSRPWNRFDIRVGDGGAPLPHYEGNWRDLFQNWEALALSFPSYLPKMVALFLDSSTVDGHNPYRLSRDGIDWEVPDPSDPWSHIGYWGDHQIVYLSRLLQAWDRHEPGVQERLLDRDLYSWADVPYRIRDFDSMVHDPKDTIDFDWALHEQIEGRVQEIGTDGRLLPDASGRIQRSNLAEKLLVPVLAKLGNFVPDGGIWLNTQRPEWNDANNALVGNGLSVVTLCHLRAHLEQLRGLFQHTEAVNLHVEIETWLSSTVSVLTDAPGLRAATLLAPAQRRRILEGLGRAYSDYRARVYAEGFGDRRRVAGTVVRTLLESAMAWVDRSIRSNRRRDGLYHTYNLLQMDADGAHIRHLPLMLEGQVAALSSGILSCEESCSVIEALFRSPLHRPDQDSFVLYPVMQLPSFLERNRVSDQRVRATPWLQQLAQEGTILRQGSDGVLRFHPDLHNRCALDKALGRLARSCEWSEVVATHGEELRRLYEEVFEHHRFTGRSSSMYKYEGIGCIYWHQVAKLVLAVQESWLRAKDRREDPALVKRLGHAYERVRGGLPFNKTPQEFGAFPADPYSHSPAHLGAQQPGMTGQVKEEILIRMGELGVRVSEGRLSFEPLFLRDEDFLAEETSFQHRHHDGTRASLHLPRGSLAFTLYGVPIVYRRRSNGDRSPRLRVQTTEGREVELDQPRLSPAMSRELFARNSSIRCIELAVGRDR